jgi:hypothetical protein
MPATLQYGSYGKCKEDYNYTYNAHYNYTYNNNGASKLDNLQLQL